MLIVKLELRRKMLKWFEISLFRVVKIKGNLFLIRKLERICIKILGEKI